MCLCLSDWHILTRKSERRKGGKTLWYRDNTRVLTKRQRVAIWGNRNNHGVRCHLGHVIRFGNVKWQGKITVIEGCELDLVFVLDFSTTTDPIYKEYKKMASSIVKKMKVGPHHTQVRNIRLVRKFLSFLFNLFFLIELFFK